MDISNATTPGEKALLDMHKTVLTEIIGALPTDYMMAALQVLNKHQQHAISEALESGKVIEEPVGSMHAEWMKIIAGVTQQEESREKAQRNVIRSIFKRHGFTVKAGETDLKEYVYEAGRALIHTVLSHTQRIGAIAYFLTSKLSEKDIEHYEAMEDRSKWTNIQWATHLGATEDDQHRLVFGSWYAFGKMLELRDKEVQRQAVLILKDKQKVQ